MQKLLKEIGDRLQEFVDQRDDIALVLVSPSGDAAPLLKILETLEESSSSHLFWFFTDNFIDAGSYANAMVKSFADKHTLVRLAMEKESMTPWPPIPESILSDLTPPVERLRELAAFSRDLLPVRNGGHSVWLYFPLELADLDAFRRFMEALVHHDFPFPWCHHLRFIIRDDPASLAPILAGYPRVQRYQPDLGPEAIDRALKDQVADETLPLDQRMAPVPILAGTDYAHGRYPEAMDKYELLLRYHASTNNLPMAAFALNGMGEVFQKQADLDRANESYEAALIPASHGENPPIPILLNIVTNLGNLCMQQGRWADGEAYFDTAQQLATVARNPTAKINALDSRGVCQQQQSKNEEAVQSWNDGAVIAAQLEDVDSCRHLLGRLEQYYSSISETAKTQELQEQLAGLGAS